MSRLMFVSLIIFSIASVKSKSFLSIATSENGKSASFNSSRDVDFSADIDGLKNSEETEYADFQRIKFYDSASQYSSEKLEENSKSGQNEDLNNLKIDLINGHSSQPSPSSKRMTTDKEIMDYLSAAYRSGYDSKDYRDYEDSEFLWPLIRREINSMKGFHDFIEPDSAPWNFEFHNRHDNDYYRQNYPQKNGYPKNFNLVKNESYLNPYQKPMEYQYSYPQYVQRKNFNNFYVIIPNGKMAAGCNANEFITFESDNKSRGNFIGRKPSQKVDWDQYLQFLKAAFQKLDEDPYYYYDESEHDDYGLSERMRYLPQPPLQTYLLGPTLYVDNSGKISQSNFHGTSYQNIGGVSANSKFTPVTPDYFRPEPTVETDGDWNSFLQNHNSFEQTTMDHSSVASTEPSKATEQDTTEPTIQNEVDFNYPPFNQEILRRFIGDSFKTTAPTTVTEETSHQYSHNPVTTHYPTTEQTTEKRNDPSSIMIFTGNPGSTHHPHPFWFTTADFQTPEPTAPFQTTTWVFPREPDTIDLSKIKADVDCNDKMLPCPDTVNVTYPLNGYCNRYVTCESGRAVRRLCSDGLHYNPITKSCDLPHNSICTYACPRPNGIYGIPGDCGGYFVCKNSILEYRMCPPKMHWDIKREQCIFEELSTCPMKCDGGSKIKSYEGDCKGYIICLQSIPYYHKCPPNTKFDPVTYTCIPEHRSYCRDDPKLLTKTLNPNVLCNNIMKKLSTKSWCEYFSANKITTTFDTD